MPVINNPVMEKYKTYFTEKIKGKDGIVRPITKVKYIKTCPECGNEMTLGKYTPGKKHHSFFARWNCSGGVLCDHSEREPTAIEQFQSKVFEEELKYGECVHHENLAVCTICNPYK